MTTSPTCSPRYATPRRADRPTLGPAVGAAARLLGKPLFPWQQQVADVVMELDPATGLLVYREWGLTVPRQSGKTTLVLAKSIQRAMATKHFGPRQRIVYTAQTRKDARRKWEEDFVEDLEASRSLRGKFRVIRSNGREHVKFENGSRFGIDATTEKSGHGPTLDEGFIDEAFAQVDNRSEQAFKPAMVTRNQPQFGVISTAGWLGESPYLWDKVESGREFAREGRTDSVAYFEWSASLDCDPADRRVWRACMPGLQCNGGLISEEAIAADLLTMGLNEFRRAYLNHWVVKDAPAQPVIPADLWASMADLYPGRLSPVAFGITVSPDRSRTTIGVAGRRADGLAQIEVVAEQPGVDWAVDWVIERVARWDPCAIVLDGTALGLAGPLAEALIEATPTTTTDRAQATVDLYDAVTEGRIRHTGDPALASSVETALKRPLSDRWLWDGPGVGPIQAVTLAYRGLLMHTPPAPPPAPQRAGDGSVAVAETADLARVGF
jgi:terminase large subunit-like protein